MARALRSHRRGRGFDSHQLHSNQYNFPLLQSTHCNLATSCHGELLSGIQPSSQLHFRDDGSEYALQLGDIPLDGRSPCKGRLRHGSRADGIHASAGRVHLPHASGLRVYPGRERLSGITLRVLRQGSSLAMMVQIMSHLSCCVGYPGHPGASFQALPFGYFASLPVSSTSPLICMHSIYNGTSSAPSMAQGAASAPPGLQSAPFPG